MNQHRSCHDAAQLESAVSMHCSQFWPKSLKLLTRKRNHYSEDWTTLKKFGVRSLRFRLFNSSRHYRHQLLFMVDRKACVPRNAYWPTLSCYLIGALAFAVGCGSGGPDLVPVSGRITIDDKPVTTGRIEFYPESGRPAIGSIDEQGRYELKTYEPGDGAKPGKYCVTITSRIIPEEGPAYNSFEDEMQGISTKSKQAVSTSRQITWVVPRKYANRNSSDLIAEVRTSGEDIDFHLRVKP